MRTETYSNTSRVPTMAIGTPVEDAFRRDLTINALYYNIHTDKVEDFTELGLKDLQSGVIRTPLAALVTLTDDPLRALRAIRFACRFKFIFSDDLLNACKDTDVHYALLNKVSIERVYAELDMMLRRNDAGRSLHLMHYSNMDRPILAFPETETLLSSDAAPWLIKQQKSSIFPNIFYNLSWINSLTSVIIGKILSSNHKAFPFLSQCHQRIFSDQIMTKRVM